MTNIEIDQRLALAIGYPADRINMTKELMQQALDALNDSVDVVQNEYARYSEMYQSYPSRKSRIDLYQQAYEKHRKAIANLEAAISQPECPTSADFAKGYAEGFNDACKPGSQPVPPAPLTKEQGKRQPLTDDEIEAIGHRQATTYTHRTDPTSHAYGFVSHTLVDFVRAIEAAHGITRD